MNHSRDTAVSPTLWVRKIHFPSLPKYVFGVGRARKFYLPTGSDAYKLSHTVSDVVRERCSVPLDTCYIIITDCSAV